MIIVCRRAMLCALEVCALEMCALECALELCVLECVLELLKQLKNSALRNVRVANSIANMRRHNHILRSMKLVHGPCRLGAYFLCRMLQRCLLRCLLRCLCSRRHFCKYLQHAIFLLLLTFLPSLFCPTPSVRHCSVRHCCRQYRSRRPTRLM